MMFKTHLAFSFFVALVWLNFFSVAYPLLFIGLVMLFGSLPDLDTTKSKIGKKLWFIAFPLSLVFKHRGFFHSIFPVLLLFFGLRAIGWSFLALAVSVAYVAHLLGDALTVEGVNFLHPISTFRIQGFLRTGSFFEMLFFVLIVVVDLVLSAKMLQIAVF